MKNQSNKEDIIVNQKRKQICDCQCGSSIRISDKAFKTSVKNTKNILILYKLNYD